MRRACKDLKTVTLVEASDAGTFTRAISNARVVTHNSLYTAPEAETTTLRYYAKWIPSRDQQWVELLAGNPVLLEPATGTGASARGVRWSGQRRAGTRRKTQ